MRRSALALLALCALCPVTGFLASKVHQAEHMPEAHAYARSDAAALAALDDLADDLLARGRRAALVRPMGLIHPKSNAEAGRIIAGMGL